MPHRSMLLSAVGLLASAPVALTPSGAEEPIAVAGDDVLVSRTDGRDLRLDRFPAAGGPPATVLAFGAPAGVEAVGARLAASATTAAAVITTSDDTTGLLSLQPFAGPAAGPLEPLGPPQEPSTDSRYSLGSLGVEGDRLIRGEFRLHPPDSRLVVVDPGTPHAEARVPRRATAGDLAGDLIAYGVATREEMRHGIEPKRLVVAEWRTGAVRWRRSISGGIESIDLHADGRVLVGEDGAGVVEVARGGAGVRRISRRGALPAYAGDAIVFLHEREDATEDRLFVAGADRQPRPFGVPSEVIEPFSAGERFVAWQAHGCVLVAPVDAGAAPAPASGPCPRSEVQVLDHSVPVLRQDRRVPVVLRCIAAPAGGCRGTIRLRLESGPVSPPRRFRVPVRARRVMTVRLTNRGAVAVRRDAATGWDQSVLLVRGKLVDPDGRRSAIAGSMNVRVRGHR